MPHMVQIDDQIIRICPYNTQRLEVSNDKGLTWTARYNSPIRGDFKDLAYDGKEILATTSKGLYASNDGGCTWWTRN